MSVRETSKEAYKQLVESGELRGKQAQILELVVKHGAGTAAEILQGSPHDRNRNLARARFTELQARGLIIEVGVRDCKVTGRQALVWEYSGRAKPFAVKKGATRAQARRAAILNVLKNADPMWSIEQVAAKVAEAL